VGMKLPMAHEGLELEMQVLVHQGHDMGMKVLDPLRACFIHLMQVHQRALNG
jgi:hypothetical protein